MQSYTQHNQITVVCRDVGAIIIIIHFDRVYVPSLPKSYHSCVYQRCTAGYLKQKFSSNRTNRYQAIFFHLKRCSTHHYYTIETLSLSLSFSLSMYDIGFPWFHFNGNIGCLGICAFECVSLLIDMRIFLHTFFQYVFLALKANIQRIVNRNHRFLVRTVLYILTVHSVYGG